MCKSISAYVHLDGWMRACVHACARSCVCLYLSCVGVARGWSTHSREQGHARVHDGGGAHVCVTGGGYRGGRLGVTRGWSTHSREQGHARVHDALFMPAHVSDGEEWVRGCARAHVHGCASQPRIPPAPASLATNTSKLII
eukprot:289577-Chlamydomonas_euryale.AAC.1